jgi:U4/U6 small nuclear ribonucleoprotein PRP3
MLAPPTALPSSSNVASESTQRSSPLAGLPSAKANLDPDLAKKVADARAKVESMAKKRALAAGNYAAVVANPYLVSFSAFRPRSDMLTPLTPKSNSSLARAPTKSEGLIDPALAARGGLAMLAHPLLMDNSVPLPQTKRERYTPMAPKFASTKVGVSLLFCSS